MRRHLGLVKKTEKKDHLSTSFLISLLTSHFYCSLFHFTTNKDRLQALLIFKPATMKQIVGKTKFMSSLIPNHNNSYDSHPSKHSKKLEKGSVKIKLSLWFEALGNEMVDGNIDENPTSKTH